MMDNKCNVTNEKEMLRVTENVWWANSENIMNDSIEDPKDRIEDPKNIRQYGERIRIIPVI